MSTVSTRPPPASPQSPLPTRRPAPFAPRPSPTAVPRPSSGGYEPLHEHHHRNLQGGAARAAIFGVSDGLLSNASLILGVAGAQSHNSAVLIAGVAGMVGGAFSMASGEFVSMKAQRELLERELELERIEISRRPEGERRELARIYESRGVDPAVANELT